MNKREFESWSRIRQKGQPKFLFRHGVLTYGLPFACVIVGSKIVYLLVAGALEISNTTVSFIFENLFLFVLCVWIGVVLAWNVWRRKENEFETYKSEENE